MLKDPLPTTLDVRKAASRGVSVSGLVALAELTRLGQSLASDEGRVEARCAFARDEENRYILELSINAELQVQCQRCLEPMGIALCTENTLAIIGDEDKAAGLPGQLEPLVVEGQNCNLWTVVEDELILSLPIVSYHDTENCLQLLQDYTQPVGEETAGEDNPFKVLEQLKPGNKIQEF